MKCRIFALQSGLSAATCSFTIEVMTIKISFCVFLLFTSFSQNGEVPSQAMLTTFVRYNVGKLARARFQARLKISKTEHLADSRSVMVE